LRFWLLSRSFRDRKDALCSGATQKAITNDGIRKLTISLPPPAEQARIVEILADAEALLGLRRRSDSRMAEVETALFYKTFRTADSTWPTDKLGRLGTLDRGRSRHRPRDEATLYGGPYPFIQTGDVSNSKGRIVTFTQTYSEEGLQQSRLWSAGTLCITIAANIAKTGVLAFEACFPDSVVGFNPGPRVTVEYIQAWLATIQKTLEDGAPQSAQKNINLETLRDLDVVIPPLDVQHRFAASLAELRSVMDAQTLSREHLIGVFDTVLDVAFRGSI
jgi:type I restriction enzyme S subunit